MVDDTKIQSLKIIITEFGFFKTKTVAEGIMPFTNEEGEEVEFLKIPGKEFGKEVDLLEPGTLTIAKGIGKGI